MHGAPVSMFARTRTCCAHKYSFWLWQELRCGIAAKMLAILALAHCASAFAPIFGPLQALQKLRHSEALVDRPSRKRGSARLNNLATASGGRRAARFSVRMTESSDSSETELCKAAETFINEQSGYWSPCIPDRLAEGMYTYLLYHWLWWCMKYHIPVYTRKRITILLPSTVTPPPFLFTIKRLYIP